MKTNDQLEWDALDLAQTFKAAGDFFYDCLERLQFEASQGCNDFAVLLNQYNFQLVNDWTENMRLYRVLNSPKHPVRNYLIAKNSERYVK